MDTLLLSQIAYLLNENSCKCIDNANPLNINKKIRKIVFLPDDDNAYCVMDRSLKHVQRLYISQNNILHAESRYRLVLQTNINNTSNECIFDEIIDPKQFIKTYYSTSIVLENKSLAFENNTPANINLGRMASIFLRDGYIIINNDAKADKKYKKPKMKNSVYNNPYLENMKKHKITTDMVCEVAYKAQEIIKRNNIRIADDYSERYKQSHISIDKDLSVMIYEHYPNPLYLI